MSCRPRGAVPWLAWAGIRQRPAPWLLLAIGIALAAFLPVVSSGLHTEASVVAVRSAVDGLPESERAVLAVTSRDLRGAAVDEVDRSVRTDFASAGLTSLQHSLTFRPLAVGGTDVTVGAVDTLAAGVRLTSGRAPKSCRPTACEVVVVTLPGGSGTVDAPALARSARPLGLIVVGRAELIDQRLVGVRLAAAELPLLLGSDPTALAELDSLSLFGRNTAWVGTLDGTAIAAQSVAGFTRTIAGLADRVNAASGPLSVSWPVDLITAAGVRADASAARFAVLGAGAGVLQLGYCLMAAAGMRRQQQHTGQLLTRRGGSTAQVLAIAALQPLVAVALGLVVGGCAGAVVVGARVRSVVADPWRTAVRAAVSTWPTLTALGLAAVLLTCAVVRWPTAARRSTQLVLDVALLGVIGATVLLLSGTAGSTGRLAPTVVVLIEVATGLLAARLWDPVIALVSRVRTPGPVWRVALVAGRRRPLLAKVTTGFLAAACCSLIFASAYRESLVQSAADQAAQQVPLDVRVRPSASVAAPLDVLDATAIHALGTELTLHPVVSSTVSVFAGSTSAAALPLTGIDPQALTEMHEFAATTGSDLAAADLARRIVVGRPPVRVDPVLPAGTTRVGLLVSGATPDITVSLWLSTALGREEQILLSGSGPALSARLAPGADRFVRAVEIAESPSHLVHRQHGIGEGSTDRELPTGDLRLGDVSANGRPVQWSWTSWGSDQATVRAAGTRSLSTHYQLGDVRVILTPGFVERTMFKALPVAVDPDTAARAGSAGSFGITVNGLTVPAQIVAVLPRMPALSRTFVLADRSAVTALLQRSAPGTASISQVWISAPGTSLEALRTQLASSAAARATVTYRTDLFRLISADPVASRSITLLTIAGAGALVLAMASMATAVRADLAQSGAEHLALELDGWPPGQLRLVLLVRWLSALVTGIPLGVAGGWVLATAAVRILAAGPDGADVVPPLQLMVATPASAVVVGAAVLGGLLACGLTTATGFREPSPRPGEVDLR